MKRQVAFRGAPLYRFVQDTKPGQVKGNGFKDVGVWRPVTTGSAKAPAAPAPRPSYGYSARVPRRLVGVRHRPPRTKSATSSQPSSPGKWQRPGYSLCSVADGAWRCFLKVAWLTDGGQIRSTCRSRAAAAGVPGSRNPPSSWRSG